MKALALAAEQKERGNEAYARHRLAEIRAATQSAAVSAQREFTIDRVDSGLQADVIGWCQAF